MTDYYVIGDVHGKAGMLEDLLKTWDGQTQLLFLGDLIDRGEDSRRVLEMVKDLENHSMKQKIILEKSLSLVIRQFMVC